MDSVVPIDEEYINENRVSISQSDLNGTLTYVNNAFCKTTAYTKEELLGASYNIIKHPDMPESIFQKMWHTIHDGQAWTGLIKNLRKDGKYYWDDLNILPIYDESNQLTGYISCARAASRKSIKENEELYEKMLASEV